MSKNIYVIRHCEAEGQSADAPLTERGFIQAKELSAFLSRIKVDTVISSPFLRAIQTIEPFVKRKNMKMETDSRLTERVLSSTFLPNWMEKLEATFYNMELKYEGGESSIEARNRIVEVVDDIMVNDFKNTVIVAHGGIISLLLNYYDDNFGFEQWKKLSNPDVYHLNISYSDFDVKRIWA